MSPFSDATNGVTSRTMLGATSATIKERYAEYFKDTVMKHLCMLNGENLNAYNKFLYNPNNWVNGNALYAFHASTALSDDGDMKSLVYAAPFKIQMDLNPGLTHSMSLYTVGYSNGVMAITENGDIVASRFSARTEYLQRWQFGMISLNR